MSVSAVVAIEVYMNYHFLHFEAVGELVAARAGKANAEFTLLLRGSHSIELPCRAEPQFPELFEWPPGTTIRVSGWLRADFNPRGIIADCYHVAGPESVAPHSADHDPF